MKKKDYIWNALGSIVFAVSFPILTILVTRIQGEEEAGLFSVVFSTAQMFMLVGNYAARAYQVSDIEGKYSFTDYQVQRYFTCAFMIILNLLYALYHGYTGEVLGICMLICIYKMIDALADVYEGELQKEGRLWKAGVSMFVRVLISMVFFLAILIVTRSLPDALLGMVTVSVVCFWRFAILPVSQLKGNHKKASLKNIGRIFISCFPLCLALFLLAYINNSPKYALEEYLPYEYQTYFNAIYFPAQVIYMLTGFVFKPMLVSMAEDWEDAGRRKHLFFVVQKVLLLITGLVIVGMGCIYAIGMPILSVVFGIDLAGYELKAVSMIAAGGMTAVINFMYYVLTVMRKQNFLMISYLAVFFLSLLLPNLCVSAWGVWGACISYLLLMSILAMVLLGGGAVFFHKCGRILERKC